MLNKSHGINKQEVAAHVFSYYGYAFGPRHWYWSLTGGSIVPWWFISGYKTRSPYVWPAPASPYLNSRVISPGFSGVWVPVTMASNNAVSIEGGTMADFYNTVLFEPDTGGSFGFSSSTLIFAMGFEILLHLSKLCVISSTGINVFQFVSLMVETRIYDSPKQDRLNQAAQMAMESREKTKT